MLSRAPEQSVLLHKRSEGFAIEPNPPDIQTRRSRLYPPNVILNSLEDLLDSIQDVLILVFIDRHELKRQAAIRPMLILPNEAIALEPADQRRFGGLQLACLLDHCGPGGK